MKKFSIYSSTILLSVIIVFLFFVKSKLGITIAFGTLIFIFISNFRLVKMFANVGFLIFLIIAIGFPLLCDCSIHMLQQNLFIILRGILIFLWFYFFFKNFGSSNAFKKLKDYLPVELINLINISTRLIPVIQENATNEFKKLKNKTYSPYKTVTNFFCVFANLAETLSKSDELQPNQQQIFIITGKIHEGKSSLLLDIAEDYRRKGVKIGGIVALSVNKNNKRFEYHVKDLKSSKMMKLATKEHIKEYHDIFWEYYFLKDGFEFASHCLDPDYLKDTEVVFIDEAGAMELENRGLYKEINLILHSNIPIVYIVVRDKFVDQICKKFQIIPTKIVHIK